MGGKSDGGGSAGQRRLLVVFFEGTSNTLSPITTQIGLFASACVAAPVSVASDVKASAAVQGDALKMSFDGCGVTHGTTGMLFAAGLDSQCDEVAGVVEAMLERSRDDDGTAESVRVVAVGLSRGGVACCKLALKLAYLHPPERVTISMLLFDPVAGNALSTGFPYTAAQSQDLTSCDNLVRVLSIYPYEPLPDLAMHAPTLVAYPSRCHVEEDVTLGCHQGALFLTSASPSNQYDVASNLSFHRIRDYLRSEGVKCRFSSSVYAPGVDDCLGMFRKALKSGPLPSIRRAHDKTGKNRRIIARNEGVECRWLNRHHRALEVENAGKVPGSSLEVPEDTTMYKLDFEARDIMCNRCM